MSILNNWHFDPVSALLSLLIAPLALYLALTARRFLMRIIRYVVDGVLYEIYRVVSHRAAATLTLRRYARLQLAGSTKYLNVPAANEVNLPIDDIFVPLALESTSTQTSYDQDTLFAAGSRIRVIGDPGSGKSSIVKRIFRDECNRAIAARRRARLPLLCELKKLELPDETKLDELGDLLLDRLRAQAAQNQVYDFDTCFEAYTKKSGLLILLDGLDEVSSQRYLRVAAAINGLSRRLSEIGEDNRIILTMRTQFHQQVRSDYSETFPTVLALKRFTPTDIFEFLRRWPFDEKHKSESTVRIYNDLTDRPTLREMCTNPLVLAMYVAQDQLLGRNVTPESRTEFYSQVLEELIIKRRARQVSATETQSLLRRQRQKIFGKLALEHLLDPLQPANVLSWQRAVAVVEEIAGIDNENAQAYLREMSKETGLITEEKYGETFRFIHLTFCEFLSAFEAIQGDKEGWMRIVEAHRVFSARDSLRSRLVEVIPFACALMPRHMQPAAIDDVCKTRDSHLIAITFLETKAYNHPSWKGFVDRGRENFLKGAEGTWGDEWLRDLHVFLVTVADAERAAGLVPGINSENTLVSLFQLFAAKASSRIASLIDKYAEQDAPAAFRIATLCNLDLLRDLPQLVVKNCDQPPFLALALDLAAHDVTRSDKWASLFAESGLRSSLVVFALNEKASDIWSSRAKQLPRNRRWFVRGKIQEDLYTDFVTIACNSANNPRDTPLVCALRLIKSPNSSWFRTVGISISGTLLAQLLAFYTAIAYSVLYYREVSLEIHILTIATLVLGVMFLASFRYATILGVYKRLLNQDDDALAFMGRFPLSAFRVLFARALFRSPGRVVGSLIGLLAGRAFANQAERFLRLQSELRR